MRKSALFALAFALVGMNADVLGQVKPKPGEWWTYGGDLASTRYSPLDQINKDNFKTLEVAWRFKTDFLGPRPEFNLQGTPLMIDFASTSMNSIPRNSGVSNVLRATSKRRSRSIGAM